MDEIKEFLPVFGFVAISFMIISHIRIKKRIDAVGIIKCKRCDFQGKAKKLGVTYYTTKIGCPNCESELWEQVKS